MAENTKKRSSACSAYCLLYQCSKLLSLAWLIMAAFGVPVEPEVYIAYKGCSGLIVQSGLLVFSDCVSKVSLWIMVCELAAFKAKRWLLSISFTPAKSII